MIVKFLDKTKSFVLSSFQKRGEFMTIKKLLFGDDEHGHME